MAQWRTEMAGGQSLGNFPGGYLIPTVISCVTYSFVPGIEKNEGWI